ncbi:uncharacterized protein LOC105689464 [Athalia rosae]|uniref:uncharacterized protein LOC105689464 n=1 Tax=Athalia rosae TaxID=37344 RepID=UPI0020347924|nr:uncharacterized protein LOC105689464 [Athalia rosae]
MGSAGQPDRSLGGGISLPQWMKSKMDSRFVIDDSTFSPPSHDDSFFYVRYSKNTQENNPKTDEGFTPISEVNKNTTAATQVTSSQPPPPDFKEVKNIDFSKHPLPCQPYVPNAAQKAADIKPPKSAYAGKVKSQGVDDGFHGPPALCGKSIVHVASQIMSSKVTKGFTLEENQTAATSEECSTRKVSKSLPASPISSPMSTPDNSPKSRRKIQSNRYFTGPFLPDKEKYQGGWILASLLGQQRETVSAKIEEEDETEEIVAAKPLSRKKSISSQNLMYIPKDETLMPPPNTGSNKNVYRNVFQAKPSELREMNFWSPTSM